MQYFASLYQINHCRSIFFFRVTPVLQWFQLNFGAGNFRGRRPGTSALRMPMRLTAVNQPGRLYVAFFPPSRASLSPHHTLVQERTACFNPRPFSTLSDTPQNPQDQGLSSFSQLFSFQSSFSCRKK